LDLQVLWGFELFAKCCPMSLDVIATAATTAATKLWRLLTVVVAEKWTSYVVYQGN
jgi:hypothetical protein